MSRMFIKQINFDNAGRLYRLTFVFSDNVRAPPEHSYRDEPEESYAVPYGSVLSAIQFGIDDCDDLTAVTLY